MSDNETYAARLHEMTDGEIAAGLETRSIENPALQVSPALLDGLWGYGPTRSGVQINEDTSLTLTAMFAAVKVLSESIGMLPLGIYEGDDDEDVKVRARDHSAYQLLRWQPNPDMTATVFKETLQANLTLWGRCYARIVFNNADEPVALYPLLSSQVQPERVAGKVKFLVRGGDGGTFAPEEILHIPGMSLNGLTGLSPVAYCREAIATSKAAEIYGSTFFGNGANLKGTLQFPTGVNLKPEQITAISESFDAKYSGVGNSNRTGIIPYGGQYQTIGCPPEDAQFLETRKFGVEEVARIYRIPPHMLGSMDRATHSNIEHASLEFLIYTLLPWLEKWEQELTRKLCGIDGKYHVKFDDRRLLRTDVTARQAFYAQGLQWGYLNPDECRALEGMKPLPNGQGQIFRSPVNMEPMQVLAALAAAGISRPPGGAPAPAATATGTQTPGVKGGGGARSLVQLRPVLEDALCRMYRKELNAVNRGKADEAFYELHRQHVRESLVPALTAAALSPEELAIVSEKVTALTNQRCTASEDAGPKARLAALLLISAIRPDEQGPP